MRHRVRQAFTTLLLVALVVLAFTGGIAADRFGIVPGFPARTETLPKAFDVLAQARTLVRQHYVDRSALDDTKFAYAATGAMVDSLGDAGHSRFLSPDDLKAEQSDLSGQFEGIGAEVAERDGRAVIVAPIPGSPAARAGLQPGDTIAQVNGQDVSAMSLTQVVALVRGPAGTSVTLTILHDGQTTPVTITVQRAKLDTPNVTWALVPGTHVAHILVSQFAAHATDELKTAIHSASDQGATAIVLDLRNDPGGLLDEAVGVASQFLPSGNVLIQRDASGKQSPLPVQRGGIAPTTPMAVVVNEGTASAAEVVAGALQDDQRASIIGTTTFGTGTVLSQFPLSGGAALLLGTQEWLTPRGRVIWHHGVVPDVTVAMPTGAAPTFPLQESSPTAPPANDPQLQAAVQSLTK